MASCSCHPLLHTNKSTVKSDLPGPDNNPSTHVYNHTTVELLKRHVDEVTEDTRQALANVGLLTDSKEDQQKSQNPLRVAITRTLQRWLKRWLLWIITHGVHLQNLTRPMPMITAPSSIRWLQRIPRVQIRVRLKSRRLRRTYLHVQRYSVRSSGPPTEYQHI